MSQNIQNRCSVFQIHAQNQFDLAGGAEAANRVAPAKHSSLGKRFSDPAPSGLASPENLGLSTEIGTGGGSTRISGERRHEVSERTLSRAAGEPPAAIWAALVISRAMCS